MKHAKFASMVAFAVGLVAVVGCGEDAESDQGEQSLDLLPKRDAGRPWPPNPGAQCRSDADCPVILLCKLCPDGSCANPNVHCVEGQCSAPNYTCPAQPSGTPCASTQQCDPGEYCTVEDGVCNRPPGCGPGKVCITLCYGTCETRPAI